MEFYYQIRSWLAGTYTLRIIDNFFDLFFKIGPYLLISIFINVAVIQYFNGKKINFSFDSEIASIIVAALIGLISPLPTYAAIPIGISLISVGVPFSAVMSFVVSSPLINPSIVFLTATQLGMEMAIARTVTAFIAGTAAGLFTIKIFKSIYIPPEEPVEQNQKPPRPILKELYRNTIFVGKTFSIAILLSAAVKALIPPETISFLLGGNSKTSTIAAIALGVPFYTCGGAAIPLVETLMDLGMAKGAVLAFFIAGPATKLETIYTYKKLLGIKVLIFYIVLTFIFSYLAGTAYSFI